MPIRSRPIGLFAAAGIAVAFPLLLAGCEAEAVELVREIEAARGDCTAEGLQRSDEECVRMMERYAGMGTELVHTYIGSLKALDAALERMPPPAFDTSGLGYALSPEFRVGDPNGQGASPRLAPGGGGYDLSPGPLDYSPASGAVGYGSAPATVPTYSRAPGQRTVAQHAGPVRAPARARSEARESGVWSRSAGGYGRTGAYGRSAVEGRWRDDARARAERRERINDGWRSGPFGYRGSGWGYGDAYRYLESGPEGYFNSGAYGYFYDGYYGAGYGYGGAYGYGFGEPRGYGYGYYGVGDARAYGYDYGYGADPAWYGGYDTYGRAPYGPAAAPGYDYRTYGVDPYGYDRWHPRDRPYGSSAGEAYRDYDYGYDRGGAASSGEGAAEGALPPEARSPAEDWGYTAVEGGAGPGVDVPAAAAGRAPARPAPHRPGILLPPEERLRRPWLED